MSSGISSYFYSFSSPIMILVIDSGIVHLKIMKIKQTVEV